MNSLIKKNKIKIKGYEFNEFYSFYLASNS